MGEVYRARDLTLKRDVALKVLPDHHRLDAQRLARFEREAQVLAALNHPNIATLHGFETSHDLRALVMELVDGDTLADRLAPGPLPLPVALSLARQLVDALDAAHEQGIVHRDLKPANIKVRPDGMVKVLDFGLAKALEAGAGPAAVDAPTLTATANAVIGTAAYMSPEQARGAAVDRRTDVWAFGCVLYEMLTGRRAFDGATSSDAIAAVLASEPDWSALSPAVPAGVRHLLRRCLEKDVRQRLRDIADARDALLEGARTGVEERAAPTRSSRRSRHRLVPIAAGVAFVAVLGALLVPRLSRTTAVDRSEQFVLLPPEGTSFGGGAIDRTPALAISPDGERLAFIATDARQNRQQLWVRPIRALDAIPLGGTDEAREPFWSPDGSFIGFFADGKLKKIPATGGTAAALADAPAGSGGTWSRDGVIVFAPDTQSGLLRVPDTGGTPTPVTALAEGEYGHVYPQFLPDGRRLLYLARAIPSRKGIYVTSVDAPGQTFLMPAREKARYAPGHLLFLQDGTLLARLFDPDTLQLGSNSLRVTDSVAFIATDGRASYDVSETGVLVYRASGLLAASQPVWVDTTGKTLGTVGDPGDYQSASLSPDRTTMVVEKHDLKTGTGDLWLIDLKSNITSRFTSDGMHNTEGIWSPDGRSVVFTGRPNGIRNLHLKQVGAQFDEPLLEPGPDRSPTDWVGSRILYHEGPAGQKDIWVLHMPERRPERIVGSQFNETGAKFSPDGRWIAYVSNEDGGAQVYLRALGQDAGARRVSVNGGLAPRWSRDGRELRYVTADATVIAQTVDTKSGLQTGPPRVLFAANMRRIEIDSALTAGAWFVADDRRFFIVPKPPGPLPPSLPMTVLTRWTAVLEGQ
jgi:Tol biopolymer transport system component/tRNA A-37 threonylcarbamoyl transferase component Bud32